REGDRRELRCGNDVAGIHDPGGWILDCGLAAEIAGALCAGGHERGIGVGDVAEDGALPGAEIEELIALDGAAERAAELVALDSVLQRGEEVAGIQLAVAEGFKR